VTGSAATGEAPHSVVVAAELQQVAVATTAVTTTAVTAPSISPAPAPVGGSQAVVVEVPDETPRRPDGTSGGACPHQPPSPRWGRSW
jgi:hypothetical protein